MKQAVIIMVMVMVWLFNSINGFAQDGKPEGKALENLLLRLKPAVVSIECQFILQVGNETKKEVYSSGTGFIITSDGYIVTNGHVIELYHKSDQDIKEFEEMALILKSLGRDINKLKIGKQIIVTLSDGSKYSPDIKQYSPPMYSIIGKQKTINKTIESGKDVAVLKIEGRNLPCVPLGDSDMIQLGGNLYVIGFPGVVTSHAYLSQKARNLFDPTVTIGHISGTKQDVKGLPVIQTDVAIAYGNSGGPAFDSNGKVVGIATFGSIKGGSLVQGFNFLVPVNTAKEFIRTSGANIPSESLFNKLWDEALLLHEQGKFKDSLGKLDEVLRLMPNQPEARKLQVSTQEIITKTPVTIPMTTITVPITTMPPPAATTTSSSLPLTTTTLSERIEKSNNISPLAIGGGIGALLIGAILFFLLRGKKSSEASPVSQKGKCIVVDMDSSNGTFINGRLIDKQQEEELKPNDIIRLGQSGPEFVLSEEQGRFYIQGHKNCVNTQKVSILKEIVIGRHESCDIRENANVVSGRHVKFFMKKES